MPPETKDRPDSAMDDDAIQAAADEKHDEQDEREERRDEREQRRADRRDERGQPAAAAPARSAARGGFFTIYKRGQGYWTRMGTAIGAALLGALLAYNLYVWIPVLVNLGSSAEDLARERQLAMGVAAVFLALYALLIWRVTNKPDNVDFLIATDSEMKKVNWTSRKELIGSTKVVIVFMFLIAFFLFAIDIGFSYFFYLIGVLKNSPFGGGGTIGGG
jgi:preprotein translocase SecE subunit